MSNPKKCIFAILLVAFYISTGVAQADDWLDKVQEKVHEIVNDFEFDTDFKVVDLGPVEIKIKVGVEPTYYQNYFSRMDGFSLSLGGNVGPDGARIGGRHVTDVTYVRQIPDWWDSTFRLWPETFHLKTGTSIREIFPKLPNRSENVIKYMKPGDFASYRANLVFNMSSSSIRDRIKNFSAIGTKVTYTGSFDIRIYRKHNNKVKLQIAAVRSEEKGFFADFSALSVFSIVGHDVDFDIVEVEFNQADKSLYLVDYTLDLNHKKARKAFDETFKQVTDLANLNSAKLINPTRSNKKLTKKLLERVSSIRNIVEIDRLSGESDGSVVANPTLSNEIEDSAPGSFKTHWFFAKAGSSTSNEVNNIKVKYSDASGAGPIAEDEYYQMPVHDRRENWSIFAGKYKETDSSTSFTLHRSNKDKETGEFLSRGFRNSITDKEFHKKEQENLRKTVLKVLPKSVSSKINWGAWGKDQSYGTMEKFRAENSIQLGPKALTDLSNQKLDRKTLETELWEFATQTVDSGVDMINLSVNDSPYRGFACLPHNTPSGQGNSAQYWAASAYEINEQKMNLGKMDLVANDICLLAADFAEIFGVKSNLSYSKKAEKFRNLVHSKLFNEIGMAYILNKLSEDTIATDLNVRLFWYAKKVEPIVFKHGEMDQTLFDSLLTMRATLHNRSYDLNIIRDILKGTDL